VDRPHLRGLCLTPPNRYKETSSKRKRQPEQKIVSRAGLAWTTRDQEPYPHRGIDDIPTERGIKRGKGVGGCSELPERLIFALGQD
jgi:hypothetical protein